MRLRNTHRAIGILLLLCCGVVVGCGVPNVGSATDDPSEQSTDSATESENGDPSGENGGQQEIVTDGDDDANGGRAPSEPNEPDPADPVDDGGDDGFAEGDPLDRWGPGVPDCGSRTVTSIPAPGQYEWIIEFEQEVEGAGGLADYFATTGFPDCLDEDFGIVRTPLTVGAGGVIDGEGAEDNRFDVIEGCLVLIGDDPLPPDFDEPDDPDERCGDDAFPLGTIIPDLSDLQFDIDLPFDSEYICVEVQQRTGCLDCSQSIDEWVMDSKVTISYTALGSIVVPAVDPCAAEQASVRIVEGEGAVVTMYATLTLRRAE